MREIINKIEPYIEDKLVSVQEHPEAPYLKIYNYTHNAQFKRAWDEVTMQCRGLIYDHQADKVVARPFPKFFNYEEYVEQGKIVPASQPIITEKYDGSLGILYWLNGTPRIATRGSFTSDQALWATRWLQSHQWEDLPKPESGITMLFEIIWRQNRIVVDYDFEGLVHLAQIFNESGSQNNNPFIPSQFKRPAQIDAKDLSKLHDLQENNKEGFVIYFPREELRLKVKFAEYVRLHKILTGLSEIGVWEYLRDNGVDADITTIAKDAPDEFYTWLNDVANRLRREFRAILDVANRDFLRICKLGRTRKGMAMDIKKTKYPHVVFAMIDKPDHRVAAIIWKMIRPKGETMSVFKQDIDS